MVPTVPTVWPCDLLPGTGSTCTLRQHSSVPALVVLYTIWNLLVISASASAGTYIGTEGEYPDTGLS